MFGIKGPEQNIYFAHTPLTVGPLMRGPEGRWWELRYTAYEHFGQPTMLALIL